jgi:hypothetical protein
MENTAKAEVAPGPGSNQSVESMAYYFRADLEDYIVPKYIEMTQNLSNSDSSEILKRV